MYLNCPVTVSVPQSPEISYQLFSFVHIQVKVCLWLVTKLCKVIVGLHHEHLVFPEGEKVKHCYH